MNWPVPSLGAVGRKVFCLLPLVLAAACASGGSQASSPDFPPAKYGGATPLEWSQRMADSQIARMGAAPRPKWAYTEAVFATSLLALADRTHDAAYADYATKLIGACVNADGSITGYTKAELDSIEPGRVVLELFARTGDPRYQKAAEFVRAQLTVQPRTSDGGFWHKQNYPNQMWLDGLYMAEPFYARYAKMFKEPADFDDVAKQFLLADKHTYDPKTSLFYHGWEDAPRKQSWADPATGHSPSFWGRADGWYAMALVDVLDDLPANHPARPAMLDTLRRLSEGLARWQDPSSGLWWQVMDQGGREGNYLEASASTMFVYTLAKAVNKGYLPADKYWPVAERGYAGIVRDLIKVDANGSLTLTQSCNTAGLGSSGGNSAYRDGTYDYYVHKTTMDNNDLKGIGPFILAGLELTRLDAPGGSTPLAATSAQ